MRPKGEETGEGKENDRAKHLPSKERIVDFSQSVLSKSAMITSLPKLNLPYLMAILVRGQTGIALEP